MESVKLTTTVRKAREGIYVVDICGDVTGFAENILTEAYNQAASAPAHTIVLNFSGLEYMNSSGIGLLVTLLIRAQRQKQHLTACGLSEHYRQIFELTRLNEAISIFDNESAALAATA